MKKSLNRRQFLQRSIFGATAIGASLSGMSFKSASNARVDKVSLGIDRSYCAPRIALGTGSTGGRRESNQTRLGTRGFR
jgi:hypothetical protein